MTKQMMTKNPEILHAFLAHLAEALGAYVCHQIDCGAQVVQLFDSWAHHLSPQQFAEFSHPYNERVMEIVRAKYPDTPLIFHANGGHGKLHEIKRSTADVIGLDWETDMAEARSIMPDRILQGNMDPMYLFYFGRENSKRSREQRERCREFEAHFERRTRGGARNAGRKRRGVLRRGEGERIRGHEGSSSLNLVIDCSSMIHLLCVNISTTQTNI